MEILFRCNRYLYYIQDEYIKRIDYIRGEYEGIKHLDDMCAIALYKIDLGDFPVFLITDKEILCKIYTECYMIFPINEKNRIRIDYTISNIKTLKNLVD